MMHTILTFQAYDRGLQTHIAWYATIKKSLFGWYVDKFQMGGRSPLPADIMADLGGSDSIPILFGQVFVADAAGVEAVFNNPNQGDIAISTDLSNGKCKT